MRSTDDKNFDPTVAIYHFYAAGHAPVKRPRAKTIEELQAQIDGFLRKHPIPEDTEKTKRIDAILLERKLKSGNL